MRAIKRREFIQQATTAGTSLSVLGFPNILKASDDRKVRLGIIGVGLRGREHLRLALLREDTNLVAIADIDPEAIAISQKMITDSGRGEATSYANGEEDFRNMLSRDDLDAVIIATPWKWHVPMAVASMKAGLYTGLEVPAALTVEECWQLVDVSEETGSPCMIMENVCYRRDVMAILQMVRKEMFGELTHMECGYQHDLRHVKFNDGKQAYGGGVEFGEKGFSEARWRTQHSVDRNGDLYPTHGIGPIAQCLNINRGNQFLYLTSMATKSRSLHNYIVDKGGENHPNAKVDFQLGDVVTTLIKTASGETIIISHDTNSPRPYSLGFRVQGTKGIWMDVNKSLYIEGVSPEEHRWESAEPYLEKYDHPLWKNYVNQATGAGHGGMDFFVVHAFIEATKRKAPTPLDVYDAATWSVISPLSEASIAQGSQPMEFPDFTRGKWSSRANDFAINGEY